MPAPGQLSLPPFTEGNTWPGIPLITVQLEDTSPPAVPIAGVRMYFRRFPQEQIPAVKLHSDGGGIIIQDANAWEVVIPAIDLPKLKVGKWYFDIEFTRTDGVVQTFITGDTEVLSRITY